MMFVCILVSFMLAAFGLVGHTAGSLAPKETVGIGTVDGGYASSAGLRPAAFGGDRDIVTSGFPLDTVTSSLSTDGASTSDSVIVISLTASWSPTTVTYTSVTTSTIEPSTETVTVTSSSSVLSTLTTTKSNEEGIPTTTETLVVIDSLTPVSEWTFTVTTPTAPSVVTQSVVRTTTSEKLVVPSQPASTTVLVITKSIVLFPEPLGMEDVSARAVSPALAPKTTSNFTISFFKSAPAATESPRIIPLAGPYYPNTTEVPYSGSNSTTAHGYNFSTVSVSFNITTVSLGGNLSLPSVLPLFRNATATAVIGAGGFSVLSVQAIPTQDLSSPSTASSGGLEETSTFDGVCKSSTTVTVFRTVDVQLSHTSLYRNTTYVTATSRLNGTLTRGRTVTYTQTAYRNRTGVPTGHGGAGGGSAASATPGSSGGTPASKGSVVAGFSFATYCLTMLFIMGVVPLVL